jgi:hypothetical protein
MSATLDELNEFHRFAVELIRESEAPLEFDELLERWYDRRDRDEINSIIRRGLQDIADGKGIPAHEHLQQLREKYGFPEL